MNTACATTRTISEIFFWDKSIGLRQFLKSSTKKKLLDYDFKLVVKKSRERYLIMYTVHCQFSLLKRNVFDKSMIILIPIQIKTTIKRTKTANLEI